MICNSADSHWKKRETISPRTVIGINANMKETSTGGALGLTVYWGKMREEKLIALRV